MPVRSLCFYGTYRLQKYFFMTAVLPYFRTLLRTLLLLRDDFFDTGLRGGAHFLHNFLSVLPAQCIFRVLAEDDGIRRDLFHAAVVNLVVFTQGIGPVRAGCNNRHHLSADIANRTLQSQLRNGKAALAARAALRR